MLIIRHFVMGNFLRLSAEFVFTDRDGYSQTDLHLHGTFYVNFCSLWLAGLECIANFCEQKKKVLQFSIHIFKDGKRE